MAEAVSSFRLAEVKYEDVLTPRTSEEFIKVAHELQEDILQKRYRKLERQRLEEQASEAAQERAAARRPVRFVDEGFVSRLKEVPVTAAKEERFSMARA